MSNPVKTPNFNKLDKDHKKESYKEARRVIRALVHDPLTYAAATQMADHMPYKYAEYFYAALELIEDEIKA